MFSDLAIRANGLGKCYRIFDHPEDRLKQTLFGRHRSYGRVFWAIRNVSLVLPRGETLGIIGRNGSGKSTFLQILSGTLQPSVGEFHVSGRVVPLLELGAGFNAEFTGHENIYIAASVLGLSDAEIKRRSEAIVSFADIGDYIHQPMKFYSSGMYARLAFAVAAHVDADILIIDEILGVGDAAFRQKCMRFMNEFKQKGTLLFVSHEIGSVVNLCQRALWLEGGQVKALGPAKEVCENYLASIQTGGDVPVTPPAPVFSFNGQKHSYGRGGAKISDVRLRLASGAPVAILRGGEEVILSVSARVEQDLAQPVIGFYVKDRLGQHLFGENTYAASPGLARPARAGNTVTAEFVFVMPLLSTGEFSIDVAIADGSLESHTQHHWMFDALIFEMSSSNSTRGLVGLPMRAIRLDIA